jgi:hypothetical protein
VLALFATTDGQSLSDFLDGVFADAEKHTVSASDDEIADFGAFMEKFKSGIAVQRLASEVL